MLRGKHKQNANINENRLGTTAVSRSLSFGHTEFTCKTSLAQACYYCCKGSIVDHLVYFKTRFQHNVHMPLKIRHT